MCVSTGHTTTSSTRFFFVFVLLCFVSFYWLVLVFLAGPAPSCLPCDVKDEGKIPSLPHPLSLVAGDRAGSGVTSVGELAPTLTSTVFVSSLCSTLELTLLLGSQVSQPDGHKSNGTDPAPPHPTPLAIRRGNPSPEDSFKGNNV